MTMRRAQPWLGTLVDIRVDGLPTGAAMRAIDAAFAEVAAIHRHMSFHEARSDLSRLHAAMPGIAVRVNTRTFDVLMCALQVAQASDGCFDPTIAAQLVESGMLPRPASPYIPDRRARWTDIELLEGNCVRLRRPLWIDLGGIAKGYAVDRAIRKLHAAGAAQACVNAGGDLRVSGPDAERVAFRSDDDGRLTEAVEVRDAAVAGSQGFAARRLVAGGWRGPHVCKGTNHWAPADRAVSVVASTCMIADALTKVVLMASETTVADLLQRFQAQACRHDARCGWTLVGAVS